MLDAEIKYQYDHRLKHPVEIAIDMGEPFESNLHRVCRQRAIKARGASWRAKARRKARCGDHQAVQSGHVRHGNCKAA